MCCCDLSSAPREPVKALANPANQDDADNQHNLGQGRAAGGLQDLPRQVLDVLPRKSRNPVER